MFSALLRSGDIKNYTALGQDGTPVYAVASQLRDTVRLRMRNHAGEAVGKRFADYVDPNSVKNRQDFMQKVASQNLASVSSKEFNEDAYADINQVLNKIK